MERAAKSAHVVASIEDLLSKVLLLLPIKDLLRFKSVSKHWRALISDPSFCRLRCTNLNPAGIFLLPTLNEYVPFSDHNSRTFQFNFSHMYSQSCNGLFLFDSYFRCLVYNPTTDSRLEVPIPVEGSGNMTLAFDPVKSRHYNIVCIRYLEPSNKQQLVIQMYSSETRSWGVCGEPFPATINARDGVYWNGAVHWLSVGSNEGGFYFNIEHQVLEKMPIMPFRNDGATRGCKHYFGHSCDHLHLIENQDSKVRFDVYEMKKDYSEWFIKYRVYLFPAIKDEMSMDFNYLFPTRGFEYKYVFRVLNVIRGEAEEDAFLVVMTPRKIMRYNLVSKGFENLYEFENSRNLEERGVEYVESLCYV